MNNSPKKKHFLLNFIKKLVKKKKKKKNKIWYRNKNEKNSFLARQIHPNFNLENDLWPAGIILTDL